MLKRLTLTFVLLAILLVPTGTALACGGLFCQNTPVDQNAERIIFTQNRDGTISAIVQIQYTGSPADFSWILPIPVPIDGEDIEVPDGAIAAFFELETQTTPIFLPPPLPECAVQAFDDDLPFFSAGAAADAEEGRVTIFSEGEVGPYGFVVIGAEDPQALIKWLRDNEYQVTR
ncbi:MAG: DUF2330 domain-containing protein, partial [Chloroflexota bacterium]